LQPAYALSAYIKARVVFCSAALRRISTLKALTTPASYSLPATLWPAWQLQKEGNEDPDQKVKDIDIAMDS